MYNQQAVQAAHYQQPQQEDGDNGYGPAVQYPSPQMQQPPPHDAVEHNHVAVCPFSRTYTLHSFNFTP
jgi:hypothetical protein